MRGKKRRKKRRVRAYTEIGRRIAALGKRQVRIAEALGVAQQTVSKKLRGETAILLSDLEKIAERYDVPMSYFFGEEADNPELAAACDCIRKRPGPHQELVVALGALSDRDANRLLEIARLTFGNATTPGAGHKS